MSYLTETQMELNLPALTYDHDSQVISVGEQNFPVDAELPQINPWSVVEHDSPNQLDEAYVCINIFTKLIGTPKFHRWLETAGEDEEVKSSTTDVIRSVFVTLQPEISVPEIGSRSSFGFGMEVTENHHANLFTFGSCACLHPHPEGRWVNYNDWHEGYCEYDFHNNDVATQTWSLLAGMGHLARLATESAA